MIHATLKQVEKLKDDYNYNLAAKNLNTEVDVTLYGETKKYMPPEGTGEFVLKPNPILRLDRIIGWHPNYTAGKVFFNQDPKLSKELIYT